LSGLTFSNPAISTPDQSRPPAGQAARGAIAEAAQATGIDFNYLLAQAQLESGLNPNARSGSSSASGLYQFLGGTWLDTLKKHGAEHGLGWAAEAASDPSRRAEVMALRYDPQVSALMAAELAGDNREALSTLPISSGPMARSSFCPHSQATRRRAPRRCCRRRRGPTGRSSMLPAARRARSAR